MKGMQARCWKTNIHRHAHVHASNVSGGVGRKGGRPPLSLLFFCSFCTLVPSFGFFTQLIGFDHNGLPVCVCFLRTSLEEDALHAEIGFGGW